MRPRPATTTSRFGAHGSAARGENAAAKNEAAVFKRKKKTEGWNHPTWFGGQSRGPDRTVHQTRSSEDSCQPHPMTHSGRLDPSTDNPTNGLPYLGVLGLPTLPATAKAVQSRPNGASLGNESHFPSPSPRGPGPRGRWAGCSGAVPPLNRPDSALPA